MNNSSEDLHVIYNKINDRFKIGTLNAHIISCLKKNEPVDMNLVITELQNVADGGGSQEMYLDKLSIKDAEKFIKDLKKFEEE